MTTLLKSSTIVQDFLTLSGFVRTHYLKQHVSEISPSAVTLGGTESWHRYDIRYDSLVYIEVLVEETNESVSSSEVFQRSQGLNQCNLIAYLQFPAEPTRILKKPLPPDASHQCGLGSIPRRHMWVEFVGSLLCTERFSPGTPVSPLLKNQNLI